ncbi:hypothetical protein HDE_14190 [Halotydeus destructor]|nr:hypothetical protein HDE_14190 [Halotydeus destructor]
MAEKGSKNVDSNAGPFRMDIQSLKANLEEKYKPNNVFSSTGIVLWNDLTESTGNGKPSGKFKVYDRFNAFGSILHIRIMKDFTWIIFKQSASPSKAIAAMQGEVCEELCPDPLAIRFAPCGLHFEGRRQHCIFLGHCFNWRLTGCPFDDCVRAHPLADKGIDLTPMDVQAHRRNAQALATDRYETKQRQRHK